MAAATLLAGGLIAAPTALAADAPSADNAPSVAGHAYNDLPYNNPDVTVTQIDNSALPNYMRNPIGQNEGVDTPNDLSQNYYSADAAALSYDGKLFVFTGHDEAAPDYGSFNMKDWGVYVTDQNGLDAGKWTHYKTVAKADLFSWATGDGAYAGQVVADDNGTPNDKSDDWFYYYIPVKDKASEAAGLDPFAIGVAKSKSPLGPWKDAIGKPLLTTSQTKIETIDPAFFVDNDGTGYLHFGTFGTQLAIKMKKDAATGRTSYTEVETKDDGTPNLHTMKDAETGANGPKGFFEAAWVFHKGDTYYNVYDGGKPGSGAATCVESNYQACVQYSTSSSPLGPWTYQGVLVPSGSATTMHPSVLQFGDKWYVTYHTGDKAGGTDFRRAVSIDEVTWKDGKMTSTAHPTKAEKTQPSRNVAPYAKVSATFTETPAYKGSVNDGRVLVAAVVPPDHWTNYRSIPQSQSGDSLIYQWDGSVRVSSSKVWFDVDSNALRAPGSWRLQYLDADGTWKDVANPSAYTTTTGKDHPNTVTFDAVTTTALKLDLTGQAVDGGYASVAVPEWEVDSADESPVIAAPAGVTTGTGVAPQLPATVDVTYGGKTVASPVIWRPVDAASYAKAGTFKAYGVVSGVPGEASVNGNVAVDVTVKDGYKPAADTTKPTVKVSLAANAGNGTWLTTAPFAAVQASDDSGLPAAKLEISTDKGANWKTVASNANAAVQTIATQGDVEVWARATDAAGNVSDVAKASGKVDSAAPKVTATVDKAKRTVTLKADDDTGSGVALIEYRIGKDGEWTAYKDGEAIAAPSSSRTTVYYRATDKAGNVSAAGSADIPSDTSVPLTGYIEKDAVGTDVDKKASSWTKGVAALNDGKIIPDATNANEDIWGTWPNTGEMRLDYEWDREVTIDSSRVQFTSDDGGLGIPASWKLQYWDSAAGDGAGAFVDIPDATYTVTANSPSKGWATGDAKGWSDATWKTPVKTTKLRMVITSGSASPAAVEWQVHAPESVTPEPPAADKTALKTALDKAAALKEKDYTTDSWKAFQKVVASAKAVYDNDKATQDEVSAAAAALDKALTDGTLVKATPENTPATKEQRDELADAAAKATDGRKQGDYTKESWDLLLAAIDAAEDVAKNPNATEADVANATRALNETIAGLVAKPGEPDKPGTGDGDGSGDNSGNAGTGNGANAQKPGQNAQKPGASNAGKLSSTGSAVTTVAAAAAMMLAAAGTVLVLRRKTRD